MISAEQRQEMLGTEVEVLVEKRTERDQKLKGRTRCWKSVVFESPDDSLVGTLQKVKVHSFNHQTLIGDLVSANELALV